MKILLDENLPHQLRTLLHGHDVFTVQFMGWSGTKNGALLKRAADAGFEIIITMDDGVQYEQNLATLPLAVMILHAPSNDIDDLGPLLPSVLAGLGNVVPRTVVRVGT